MRRAVFSRAGDKLMPSDLRTSTCGGEKFSELSENPESGKTTLARCLMRLIQPSGGSIVLDGIDISQMLPAALRPHRRRLQVVFQDPFRSLNARMRVRDVIAEGLLNFGIPKKAGLFPRPATCWSAWGSLGTCSCAFRTSSRRSATANLHRPCSGVRPRSADRR
jgi:ABC-type dipeptide/oligopeptide/nickel transport system ATPase subunit